MGPVKVVPRRRRVKATAEPELDEDPEQTGQRKV
jgi:hypothetical protein